MPAGCAFEPAAAGELKTAPVVLPLESHLRDDGLRTHELEVEARAERLVDETQLHERGFEQHASLAQERQELGRVLAPHIDRRMARVAAFEAREHAQSGTIAARRKRLPAEG